MLLGVIFPQYKINKQHKMKNTTHKPPFRVGERQGMAVLDAKGHTIAIFKKGCEDLAQEYCDIINAKKREVDDKKMEEHIIEVLEKETPESMKAWHNYYLRRKNQRHRAMNQHIPEKHNQYEPNVFDKLDNVIGNYMSNDATAHDVADVANEVNEYLHIYPHPRYTINNRK